MCDYSLRSVRSRPANIDDHLITVDFGTGTVGFAAIDDRQCAVCLQPGTELTFSADVRAWSRIDFLFWRRHLFAQRTAVFRQINTDYTSTHHDAIEFPDGRHVLLTRLYPGQYAIVLQLPLTSKVYEANEKRLQLAVL